MLQTLIFHSGRFLFSILQGKLTSKQEIRKQDREVNWVKRIMGQKARVLGTKFWLQPCVLKIQKILAMDFTTDSDTGLWPMAHPPIGGFLPLTITHEWSPSLDEFIFAVKERRQDRVNPAHSSFRSPEGLGFCFPGWGREAEAYIVTRTRDLPGVDSSQLLGLRLSLE